MSPGEQPALALFGCLIATQGRVHRLRGLELWRLSERPIKSRLIDRFLSLFGRSMFNIKRSNSRDNDFVTKKKTEQGDEFPLAAWAGGGKDEANKTEDRFRTEGEDCV